jgi:hypothetical protein
VGIMRRERFPSFVQYSNESARFGQETPENIEWAWRLSFPTLPSSTGSIWEPEEPWEQPRGHQRVFLGCIDRIVAAQSRPAVIILDLMKALTDHCAHVRLECRRDGSAEKVRRHAAQRHMARRPSLIQALVQKGYEVREPALPTLEPRGRYPEPWTLRDSLGHDLLGSASGSG